MHLEAALVVFADAWMRVLAIDARSRVPAQLFATVKTVNFLNA